MSRDEDLYLEDIIEAMEKIEEYSKGVSLEEFSGDPQLIDAVVRNFEVIGEAVKNVSDSLKKEYPDVPWREMAGMRDKLIHEYFGVKKEVLWKTVREDIPGTRLLIEEVLREKEGSKAKE